MKHNVAKGAAALALAAAAFFAVPAAASAYTPDFPDFPTGTVAPGGAFSFSVAPGTFNAGDPVTVSLSGENASGASLGSVPLVFESNVVIGTLEADASGAVSPTIILPADAAGDYTLTLSGSGVTITAPTVRTGIPVPGAVGGPALEATGGDSAALMGIWIAGGALVLAGAGVTTAAVVRRQRQDAA